MSYNSITRQLEDMNFMFSWQEQYLTSDKRTSEIWFLPPEHKIHIFSRPCNILYIFRFLCIGFHHLCIQTTMQGNQGTFISIKKTLMENMFLLP